MTIKIVALVRSLMNKACKSCCIELMYSFKSFSYLQGYTISRLAQLPDAFAVGCVPHDVLHICWRCYESFVRGCAACHGRFLDIQVRGSSAHVWQAGGASLMPGAACQDLHCGQLPRRRGIECGDVPGTG